MSEAAVAFNKYSDGKYSRRRSQSRSIDVFAIQGALKDMGITVSMVELFGVVRDYRCQTGMHGQIEYEQFAVILRNARAQFKQNPLLTAAFKALGGEQGGHGGIAVSDITRSLSRIKDFGIDVDKLETVCAAKEETDIVDFNEFCSCFE